MVTLRTLGSFSFPLLESESCSLSLFPFLFSGSSPLGTPKNKGQRTYTVSTEKGLPGKLLAVGTSDQESQQRLRLTDGVLLYFIGSGQTQPINQMELRICNHVFMLSLLNMFLKFYYFNRLLFFSVTSNFSVTQTYREEPL